MVCSQGADLIDLEPTLSDPLLLLVFGNRPVLVKQSETFATSFLSDYGPTVSLPDTRNSDAQSRLRLLMRSKLDSKA
eukprot:2388153-Amphidinium_carterae.1